MSLNILLAPLSKDADFMEGISEIIQLGGTAGLIIALIYAVKWLGTRLDSFMNNHMNHLTGALEDVSSAVRDHITLSKEHKDEFVKFKDEQVESQKKILNNLDELVEMQKKNLFNK